MTRKFLLLVGFVLAMVIVSGAPYQIASADSPEEGETEFSKRCVSCHTIGGGQGRRESVPVGRSKTVPLSAAM